MAETIEVLYYVDASADAVTKRTAQYFVDGIRAAAGARGKARIAISGGHTPKNAFALLADPSAQYREQIPWENLELFWGDERCVPPDHPDSNYRMTREAMIDHVPLPPENVHRIRGEDPPEEAALEYERVLREFFGSGDRPARSFDLVLLGLGSDGHTASIF